MPKYTKNDYDWDGGWERKPLQRYDDMIVLSKKHAKKVDMDASPLDSDMLRLFEDAMSYEFERITGETLYFEDDYVLVDDTTKNSKFNKWYKTLVEKLEKWLADSYNDGEFYRIQDYTQARK